MLRETHLQGTGAQSLPKNENADGWAGEKVNLPL